MTDPDDTAKEVWETPSLRWIHEVREAMWRRRGGRPLTEPIEGEFDAGIELAKRLGLRIHEGPVRKQIERR